MRNRGKPLRVFWWSPARHMSSLYLEMTQNLPTWSRLARVSGRPFLNFGDELTPHIMSYLTGRKVRWVAPSHADLIATGSIIEFYVASGASGADVFGSGSRGQTIGNVQQFCSKLGRILAVRGPETASTLMLENPVFGDPGVLSRVLPFSGLDSGKTNVLVIPHFRTWSSAAGLAELSQMKSNGWTIAPPTLKPLRMLSLISASQLVLSSSLHGVICAHALGTPVKEISLPATSIVEPTFKYGDYFTSIGLQYEPSSIHALEKVRDFSLALDKANDQKKLAFEETEKQAAQLMKAAQLL